MSTTTIYCDSGDCWADKAGNFSSTGTQLYVVDSPGVTNSNVRTWIPFTIPFRGITINSAYITITANATSDTATGNIRFGCEAADNVTTPVSAADLYARPLSAYLETHSIGQFVFGTAYTFKIDNPIQETINRPGWREGNTLAVIIDDVDIGDSQRSIYSYEGNASLRAYLTLNYTDDSGIDFIVVL